MSSDTKIIHQLRALVLLTHTEEQVARTRISQARTDAVRRELTQNADNAAKRSLEITEALRTLGGVPDVVTPAVGRASAMLKATFEQAAPFEEALFTDLQLEHTLVDRATYLKVLADQAGETAVRQLAEKLVDAHRATVEWLTVVLAEDAMGGPAALVPTPLQKVAGGVARAVNAPVRFVANTVNQALDTVQQAGDGTTDRISSVAARAGALTDAVRETFKPGRGASMRKADVARRVSAGDLPIENYDQLSQDDAIDAVRGLTAPRDIQVVIAYEESHQNRSSVASAAQTRLAALATEAVGVSD